MDFASSLKRLDAALKSAQDRKIELGRSVDKDKAIISYSEKRREYHQRSVASALEQVKEQAVMLAGLMNCSPSNHKTVSRILETIPGLDTDDIPQLQQVTSELILLCGRLKIPPQTDCVVRVPNKIPEDIMSEIVADIKELNSCFSAGCYRSCAIICGRILETALHRKYYEVTGFDILEKNPGIGLGKLVAKLSEKNVGLDPGLTQQIHLINQVRIFSVHKKQDAFYPTKMQAQAIVLYTIDILDKIF